MDQTPYVYMLVGAIGAGKTTFAKALAARTSGRHLSTSEHLAKLLPVSVTAPRAEKQKAGDEVDRKTDGAWILHAVQNLRIKGYPSTPVVVDCVRSRQQIRRVREFYGQGCLLIGIRTRALDEHIRNRNYSVEQMQELIKAATHPLEQSLPMDECDMIFDNTRFTAQELIQSVHFAPIKKER